MGATDNAAQASAPGVDRRSSDLDRLEAAFPHPWSLRERLLVAAYVGSTAHGTYTPSTDPDAIDDVDIMMVVVPPPEATLVPVGRFDHWSPASGTLGELDVVCYSVSKFTGLLLKGNPNVLGMLWLQPRLFLASDKLWLSHWYTQRDIFSSRRAYLAFSGYAYAQLHKLGHPGERAYMGAKRKELVERFGFDAKNAAHCLRLLRMGVELLETGELRVNRDGIDSEELRAVKRGDWPLERIHAEAEAGFARMRAAEQRSTLPDHPDEAKATKLLLTTYARMWRRYPWWSS